MKQKGVAIRRQYLQLYDVPPISDKCGLPSTSSLTPFTTHTDMQVSLSLPPRLPLPVRVSPPGASLITADPRVLRWEFSSPQSPLLVPGGVLALAAVFMVEVGVAEEVMAELAAHRLTAEVCLNGVTGRYGRERAAEGMRVLEGRISAIMQAVCVCQMFLLFLVAGSTFSGSVLHQACQQAEAKTSSWQAHVMAYPEPV